MNNLWTCIEKVHAHGLLTQDIQDSALAEWRAAWQMVALDPPKEEGIDRYAALTKEHLAKIQSERA